MLRYRLHVVSFSTQDIITALLMCVSHVYHIYTKIRRTDIKSPSKIKRKFNSIFVKLKCVYMTCFQNYQDHLHSKSIYKIN